jgi:AraC-like DNA-binding protein
MKESIDSALFLLRIRLNCMKEASHEFTEPASRWLGVGNRACAQGRELSSTDSRRQGQVWKEALPRASVSALLVMAGRVRWSGKLHEGAVEGRELSGKMLWVRADPGWTGDFLLVGEGNHRALLLSFPISWVRQKLADLGQELSADWRALLLGGRGVAAAVERPMEAEDRGWAKGLMAPSLCEAARQLLEGSRLSEFFYRKVLLEARGDEMFCTRTRRLALDRVERVRKALKDRMEAPPSLEALATQCGCNPHYLSRTFTAEAGMTITHYLRKLRIEKAAALMAQGTHNASEAALEVGYQSMSHFSVAFKQVQGWTPSEWARRRTATERQLNANQRQSAILSVVPG